MLAFDAHELRSFGSAVAIDDGWIIVGAIHDLYLGTASGAAYAYQRRGAGWQFAQKFAGHDTSQSDTFGGSIALELSTCVGGAKSEFPNGVFGAGSAYVFERAGTQWIETQKLVATPTIPNANFGWSMALDRNRLLVGARGENSPSTAAGAVYVFERVGGVWSQTARLRASDPAPFDFFGQTVALHGDTAMIGSASDGPAGDSQGAAYVFEFDGVQWNEVAKLRASDPGPGSSFSASLALGSDVALIGSATHAHASMGTSGAVYAFHRIGGVWQQTQELLQHAPSNGLLFGASISLSGDVALIGSPGDPYTVSGYGAAYVFELAPDTRQFGWCMSGAPCGNHDKNAGCANSTTFGATLGAAGSSSVVLDELRFEVRRMLPLKNAVLFMGNGVGQAVLGDGLRVVASAGSGLYRYGVLQSGPDGSIQQDGILSRSQLFPPSGAIQPGSVWNFQVWYRDAAGPCGSGTNLTNALEVTFRP